MDEDPTPSSPEIAYAQLISLAVHELRTPASVVGGYLRMLQRETTPPLGDRQRKMIDEAEKSCARLVALIAELSDVAKLDDGRTTLAREPFDLFSTVEEVAKGVHEAAERGVRLEVRGEAAGAPMIGDSVRLRGAFEAIFRAILREQPAAVTVVADRRRKRDGQSDAAVVVVADESGVQRAYESEPHPFDDKRGGLGLALPIARRIIERHGGRLWSPQNGTERGAAVIALPLSSESRR